MTRRMVMAVLAMCGVFIAVYLTLHKLGKIGPLVCAKGFSCATVQESAWASFIGIPVAMWGLGFYVFVLALTVLGTTDSWSESRPLALATMLTTGWGVLFSGWLTYLEAFEINAWCMWCLISAGLTVVLFGLSVLEWRGLRAAESA